MTIEELSLEAQELLGRLREETRSSEEKERLLVALDALRFIAVSGQSLDFGDYRQSLDDRAPPLVVAAFDTRSEAEDWLRSHPRPPHHAYVLVAGEYHVIMYVPERNLRRLLSHPVLEFYLAEMVRDGIPAPVATFHTWEEATDWLHGQPEPPRQVFILVGGEPHLAVYHHRINLRALYPIAKATEPARDAEPET